MTKLQTACALVLLLCGTASMKDKETRAQTVTRTLHVAPLNKGDAHYTYVPFEVSPNIKSVHISYDYDRANGLNVLDIGLFDSRSGSLASELRGFRGWSGGRRSEFFVSQNNATPGYLPGATPAGTWHIILGLYRVGPSGVDVTFKIELSRDETKLPSTTSASSDAKNFFSNAGRELNNRRSVVKRWVTGDLHMHTIHSDGDWTVSDLVTSASNSGLDFICITDHNTSGHHDDVDTFRRNPSVLVMRGEEVTSYGGHANVWGLSRNALIDWRVEPEDQVAMRNVASAAHRNGALISVNHPFALCAGCNWTYKASTNDFDAIEVWNGSWDPTDDLALAMWDGLLRQGRHITAVGSSDSHRPTNMIGSPSTHLQIQGQLSDSGILKAIRSGRAYVTANSASPSIKFEAQRGSQQRTIGEILRLSKAAKVQFKLAITKLSTPAKVSLIGGGQLLRSFEISEDDFSDFEFDVTNSTYFRLEVRSPDGKMLALTNPIYVEIKTSQAPIQ